MDADRRLLGLALARPDGDREAVGQSAEAQARPGVSVQVRAHALDDEREPFGRAAAVAGRRVPEARLPGGRQLDLFGAPRRSGRALLLDELEYRRHRLRAPGAEQERIGGIAELPVGEQRR